MSDVTDERLLERVRITRALRHRLESLRRAGVDRLPTPPDLPAVKFVAQERVARPTPAPEPVEEMAPPAPPVRDLPKPKAAPAPSSVGSLFGDQELEAPVVPVSERPGRLDGLRREVAACTRCAELVANRTQTVFGVGTPSARLMFVGEAPGADEDRTGVPFVGRAGQLLTDMITKGMGISRDDVYIANVIKSRPPENRPPSQDEVANCLPFLERQIEIIRPQFLCLLGKVAASALLETMLPMGKLRGRWHRYRGIPAVVTWHPAYLLRNPASKKETWDDLQMLMKAMGLTPPGRK